MRLPARAWVLAIALGGTGLAQADPRLEWRTLESEHFEVHFPSGGYPVALQTARYLEAAHARLVPVLGHRPRRKTQVVLTDDTNGANGSATTFPIPLVRAFMSPPHSDDSLATYDDYLWVLLVHEYTHILHLGAVSGLPELGNRIFGDIFQPNGVQPTWVIEGLATYYESELSGASGRNNSALGDMYLRAQVLDTGLWPIDRVSGPARQWPGAGTLSRFYGGRVWKHVAQSLGAAAPGSISHDYGSRPLPYALNFSARSAVGRSFDDLYDEWRGLETQRHRRTLDRVREAGVIEGTRRSRLGRRVRTPRWRDDDSLVVYVASGDRFPSLWQVEARGLAPADLNEGRMLRRMPSAGLHAVHPGGEMVVYVRGDFHELDQFYDDLYASNLGDGPALRLTYGWRARDPAISADGHTLAFVAERRGHTAVYVASIRMEPTFAQPVVRLGTPVRVFEVAHTEVDRPTLSPNGDRVAFSVHRRTTQRDIALVDLRGLSLPPPRPLVRHRIETAFLPPDIEADDPGDDPARLTWLCEMPTMDVDPAFSRDGKTVYYVSDVDGVSDVFAQPVQGLEAAGPRRRVTRTLTGAFEPRPSPDGTQLAYVGYTNDGFDLWVIDLDPARQPEEPLTSTRPSTPGVPDDGRVYPVRPYRPWATLRPFYWLPFYGFDAGGSTFGVSTTGRDAVGHHDWSTSAWFGADSGQPGYRGSYHYRRPRVDLGFSSSRTFSSVGQGVVRDGRREAYQEVSWRAAVDATLNLPASDRSQSYGIAYSIDHRVPRTAIDALAAGEAPPQIPERGTVTRLELRWSASTVHGFPDSISSVEGLRLGLSARVATPLLGGDFSFVEMFGTAAAFTRVPFTDHHVFAAQARFGAGIGDFGGRRLFAVGGLRLDDPLRAVIEGFGFGGPTIRGYPANAFTGDSFAVLNLEYRLPLYEPEVGLGSLPVFFQRVTAAGFFDVGGAADPPLGSDPSQWHAGVGAELRVRATLGYLLALELRIGYAHGLSPGGISAPFVGFGGAF